MSTDKLQILHAETESGKRGSQGRELALAAFSTSTLEAEVARRREAERKAKWARGKAAECLQQAYAIEAKPSLGRSGREMNKARSANYARAEARDWEKKAKRFEEEAGIAPVEYSHPF